MNNIKKERYSQYQRKIESLVSISMQKKKVYSQYQFKNKKVYSQYQWEKRGHTVNINVKKVYIQY